MTVPASRRFRTAYAAHRAAEGRGAGGVVERDALPYLRTGPLARAWAVRARTWECFRDRVVQPLARARGAPLAAADLGAGNGWLCHRLMALGHCATAVDLRTDSVDGLGAAGPIRRVAASFDTLPLASHSCDLAVFNAALHYATDLSAALAQATRVTRPQGVIAILDSPFYARDRDGDAMVTAKRRHAAEVFGARAGALLALPHIEYLTPDRLAHASDALGLTWERHRVRYPLWYELRPVLARLRFQRRPSRFDCWTAVVP